MLERLFGNIDRMLLAKLVAFQIFVIALSNYLVTLKFNFMGTPIAYGAFTFPLVVVATDLTVRLLGKRMGRTVVAFAFIPAILVSIAVVALTGAPSHVAVRIGLGSGIAYTVSTLLDVYVFQYFREKFSQWWVAPTLASIFTMVIDTYTFYYVAFANVPGSRFEHDWFQAAGGHTVIKIIVSLLVILPAYGVLLNYLQSKIEKK